MPTPRKVPAAFGYWFVACIGDVAYWVLITATLGSFFPAFGSGDRFPALLLSTLGIWSFHLLILSGVKGAAVVNIVVTVAKIIPIMAFVALLGQSFEGAVFAENFWGGAGRKEGDGLLHQIRATMLITVFVFIGVEGANVYSRYAQRRSDVGKATISSFLFVLGLLLLVTLLPYGILARSEIAALPQPSMAALLAVVVGGWGAIFISLGLLISILGAYLAWTLLAIEVLYIAAGNGDMPRLLRRENKHGVPAASLWFSTITVQILLLLTLLADDTIQLLLELSASMVLVPYFLVAVFAFKLAWRRRADERFDMHCLIVASIALIYTAGMVYAGGLTILLLSLLFYAPGTILYVMIRREQEARMFTAGEMVLCAVVMLGGLAGLTGLCYGVITL